jgi:hypothetical protein
MGRQEKTGKGGTRKSGTFAQSPVPSQDKPIIVPGKVKK